MLVKSFAAISTLASVAVADSLSLYAGRACNSAFLGGYEPIPEGECIAFGQAASYVIEIDDQNTYNLYSGEGCSVYEGQVSISGCTPIPTTGEGNTPTHIVNQGPQPIKRSHPETKAAHPVRGFTPVGARRDTVETIATRRGLVYKRADGDTYQCPNVPYYFVVTKSSSVRDVDTSIDEETIIESAFEGAFTNAYNQGGQTTVRSETIGDQNEDIVITLNALQGTIGTYIRPNEADDLITDLNNFREQQQNPAEFFVAIYTGQFDRPDGNGPFASFQWVLE